MVLAVDVALPQLSYPQMLRFRLKSITEMTDRGSMTSNDE